MNQLFDSFLWIIFYLPHDHLYLLFHKTMMIYLKIHHMKYCQSVMYILFARVHFLVDSLRLAGSVNLVL